MDVVVLLTVFECVSVVRRSSCCWSPSDGEWGLRRNQIGVGVSSPHGPTRQGLKVSWAGGLAGLWWLPWHGICVCSNTSVCRGCAFVVYERILFLRKGDEERFLRLYVGSTLPNPKRWQLTLHAWCRPYVHKGKAMKNSHDGSTYILGGCGCGCGCGCELRMGC